MSNEITQVLCSRIVPGDNHRKVFDLAKLKELANSIAKNGLAQPITIRPIVICGKCEARVSATESACPKCGSDDWVSRLFEIAAGERRFRAVSQILKWETIPAIIRDLDDRQAKDIMLLENTARVDLNPIEEAEAYHEHMQTFGCDESEVAKIAGKSIDLVKRRLALRKLVEEIMLLVAGGHFPLGHAEAITDLDPNRQRIATRIFRESKNGLPLSAFRSIVSQLAEEQAQDSLFNLESFWVTQVQQMADLPRRGKRAVTGAPTRSDLPRPEIGQTDNQGVIIDRYIAQLLAAGFAAEAAAIGNLYDAMVKMNYISVPPNAKLLTE
jgi:ParB/RepB/Spo0J family partition protein